MKTTDLMIFPNMFIYLQDFFERTAEFLPQGIAVEDGPQQVTYAALERRANQLARVLLQNGGGPNARVGIFTAKNVQAYAGVLGTLKSGSCWAPLGENFPDRRLLFLLQSLEPVAVIVQDSTAQRMLALRQAHGQSFAIIQLDGAGRPGVIGPETLDAVSESRRRYRTERRRTSPTSSSPRAPPATEGSHGLPSQHLPFPEQLLRFFQITRGCASPIIPS
jgi:acyl-CoA synthetase (AMP-forming)/AMP-acid ligase II